MNRRTVLSSIEVPSGILLAGCLSNENGEPVATPALVEIENDTGKSIDVHVRAREGDALVHDEQYTIGGVQTEESDDTGEHGVIDGVQIVEDWMENAAEYSFHFEVPEHGLETSFSSSDSIGAYENANQSDLEDECYFVRVTVGDEEDTHTARVDANPNRVVAWAEVYDHDVFERAHAGDCT